MNDEAEPIKSKLQHLGILGIFILTRDGMPLLVREYNPVPFAKEPLLVGGFLSAFGKFATEEVSGLLSDIGLHTARLFFDYTEDLLFLLAIDEMHVQSLPTTEVRMVTKGSLSEVKSALLEYFADYSEKVEDLVGNPRLFEKLRKCYFGNVIRSFQKL